jgi:hypothetical protein
MDATAIIILSVVGVLVAVGLLIGLYDRRARANRRRPSQDNHAAGDPMPWTPSPAPGYSPPIRKDYHRPRVPTDEALRARAAREGRPYRPGMYGTGSRRTDHPGPDLTDVTNPASPLHPGLFGTGAMPAQDGRTGHVTHHHHDTGTGSTSSGDWGGYSSGSHSSGSSSHDSGSSGGGYSGGSDSGGGGYSGGGDSGGGSF